MGVLRQTRHALGLLSLFPELRRVRLIGPFLA
jgi:hypothetical protein